MAQKRVERHAVPVDSLRQQILYHRDLAVRIVHRRPAGPGINAKSLPPGVEQQLKEHFIAGWGGFPLVGTKEQLVDGLAMLSRAGFDGVILSWARYVEEMREFQRETLPLLVQAGLR